MNTPFTTTGTLTDATTVTLDSPFPTGTGRVKVTVEPVPEEPKPQWLTVLERIWADQIARGHVPVPAEQLESFLREERSGWDHRP